MQYFVQYLKSLFFNFLTVFFANHIFSGIEVTSQTKLPHIGGDSRLAELFDFPCFKNGGSTGVVAADSFVFCYFKLFSLCYFKIDFFHWD